MLSRIFRALLLGGVLTSPQAAPSGLQMTPPSHSGTENPRNPGSPDFILILSVVQFSVRKGKEAPLDHGRTSKGLQVPGDVAASTIYSVHYGQAPGNRPTPHQRKDLSFLNGTDSRDFGSRVVHDCLVLMYTPSQRGNYHHSTFHNPTAAVNLFHVGKTVSDILQSQSGCNT